MQAGDWSSEDLRCIGMLLGAAEGQPGDLLLILSAGAEDLAFHLPEDLTGRWRACLDTAAPAGTGGGTWTGNELGLRGRSLVVLERIE
jgi:pullulanase/glycogen debranching enzyme